MITEITPEQRVQLDSFFAERRRLCTNTEPVNREKAETAITKVYRRLGHAAPEFVWVSGVREFAEAQHKLKLKSLYKDFCKSTNSLINRLFWKQVQEQISDSEIWNYVAQRLPSATILLYAMRTLIVEQLSDDLRLDFTNYMSFPEESSYLAAIIGMISVLGVKISKEDQAEIAEWEEVAATAGWIAPYSAVCLCSDRYQVVHFDDEFKLHCTTGPALVSRDGLEVYAQHGKA